MSRPTHSGREVVVYGLVVLGIVAWGMLAGYDPPDAPEELIDSAAPALSGRNLTDEGALDLASMKGRPTVVVFWLPWCTHCQTMTRALQEAWVAASPNAHILTVGMVYSEPDIPESLGPETPESFVTTTGLTLPTMLGDWARERSRWGFRGVPTTFVLDADHVVRRVFVGATDPATILAAVGELTMSKK